MQITFQEPDDHPSLDLLPLFVARDGPPYGRNVNSTFSPSSPTQPQPPDGPGDIEELESKPLPFGWTTQVASNGRRFYINHNLRITTWEFPTDSEAVYSIAQNDSNNLPLGWEKRVNKSGQAFFLDHNAGITTWEDPRAGPVNDSPLELAPLHRKLTYLASHLRSTSTGGNLDDLWVSRDSIVEDSVEAVFHASNELLKGEFGIRLLDDTRLPVQDWMDILFTALFSPGRKLFQPSESKLSQMDININYMGGDSLKMYSFAGRLHAVAILQRSIFDLSFLPFLYGALSDYDTRGTTHGATSYRSGVSNNELDSSVLLIQTARSLRMEAFMDAFVELIPPHLLQVFTLPELTVALAAGRSWVTLENSLLEIQRDRGSPGRDAQDPSTVIPSHTNEKVLDQLMVKLTGYGLSAF